MPCPTCRGVEWVCENHTDKPWDESGCQCGAGAPCPACNPLARDSIVIDGHELKPLANGGCYVISDGVKTFHADAGSASRHVGRMAGERVQYEARRVMERRR